MRRVTAVALAALVLAAGCGSSRHCSAELILRAVPTQGHRVTPAGMQTAQQIIRGRLDRPGVSSPSVTVRSGDEIVIRYAGTPDLTEIAKLATTPGRLEMFDFEPSLAPPTVRGNMRPAPLPSLPDVLKAAQQDPAGREPVSCNDVANCPGAGSNGKSKTGEYWYLFKLPPALTGADIVRSSVSADVDQNTGQPIVVLTFTRSGSAAFRRITKAEYDRGRINAGEAGQLASTSQTVINLYAGHNAIVLDGKLEETPYIDYTDAVLSHGIVGANAQITEPSAAAARRVALVLKSGSLPYGFKQVEHSSCSR
jgi:preprotein translocase subunit SecD